MSSTAIFAGFLDPDITLLRLRPHRRRPAPTGNGWFFALQEQITEPRFGLDETVDPAGTGSRPLAGRRPGRIPPVAAGDDRSPSSDLRPVRGREQAAAGARRTAPPSPRRCSRTRSRSSCTPATSSPPGRPDGAPSTSIGSAGRSPHATSTRSRPADRTRRRRARRPPEPSCERLRREGAGRRRALRPAERRVADLVTAADADAARRGGAELSGPRRHRRVGCWAIEARPPSTALDGQVPVALLPVRIETRFAADAARPCTSASSPTRSTSTRTSRSSPTTSGPAASGTGTSAGRRSTTRRWPSGGVGDARRPLPPRPGALPGSTRCRPTNLARRDPPTAAGVPRPPTARRLRGRARSRPPRCPSAGWRRVSGHAALGRGLPQLVGPGARSAGRWPSPDGSRTRRRPRTPRRVPHVQDAFRWALDPDAAGQARDAAERSRDATWPSAGARQRADPARGARRRLDADARPGRRRASGDAAARGHAATGDLAFVAPGTPTNNTGTQRSRLQRRAPPTRSRTGHRRSPVADPDTAPDASAGPPGRARSGSARQALALGPGRRGSGTTRWSAALVDALWEATGGYYLSDLLDPLGNDALTAALREHAAAHLHASGPLPAIRLGPQPYGVLPVSRPRGSSPHRATRPPRLNLARVSGMHPRPCGSRRSTRVPASRPRRRAERRRPAPARPAAAHPRAVASCAGGRWSRRRNGRRPIGWPTLAHLPGALALRRHRPSRHPARPTGPHPVPHRDARQPPAAASRSSPRATRAPSYLGEIGGARPRRAARAAGSSTCARTRSPCSKRCWPSRPCQELDKARVGRAGRRPVTPAVARRPASSAGASAHPTSCGWRSPDAQRLPMRSRPPASWRAHDRSRIPVSRARPASRRASPARRPADLITSTGRRARSTDSPGSWPRSTCSPRHRPTSSSGRSAACSTCSARGSTPGSPRSPPPAWPALRAARPQRRRTSGATAGSRTSAPTAGRPADSLGYIARAVAGARRGRGAAAQRPAVAPCRGRVRPRPSLRACARGADAARGRGRRPAARRAARLPDRARADATPAWPS